MSTHESSNRLKQRAIFALLVYLSCHYAYVVPGAIIGPWAPLLIPGRNLWSMSGHLLFICSAWVFFGTRGAIVLTVLALSFGLVMNQFVAGWPTPDMEGFGSVLGLVVLQYFLAPLLALAILLKADTIAPHAIKGWSTT